MITSSFKQNKKNAKQEGFPLVAYHKLSERYVLLTSEESGTVLVSPRQDVGSYSKNWNFGQHPEDWEVIPDAKIEVSN